MDAGSNRGPGQWEIFVIATKTGDDSAAFGGVNRHRLAADRMPRRQDDINTVGNIGITVDLDNFYIIQNVRIVTMIDWMGVL